MPYFRMGGGAGHFASTVTVPKDNGPSNGYELLVNNVYDNLQMLFEEGNINGTVRFKKK